MERIALVSNPTRGPKITQISVDNTRVRKQKVKKRTKKRAENLPENRDVRERDIFSFSCLQLFIAMDSRSWSLLGRSSLEREPKHLFVQFLRRSLSFSLSTTGGSIIIT